MDRWRVLVVDDNRDTLDLIRMALEEEYDVLTIEDPLKTPDALDLLEPDLAVLDVMMPKINGFQLVEYMKKHKRYKEVPVIFLTAKGAIADQKYGYSLGASLYLTKPFHPSRLLKNIKLMFENLEPSPRAKKHSLKEVELLLTLQEGTVDGSGTSDKKKGGKPATSTGPRDGEMWVD